MLYGDVVVLFWGKHNFKGVGCCFILRKAGSLRGEGFVLLGKKGHFVLGESRNIKRKEVVLGEIGILGIVVV